jgi:uncharacterized protein
MKIAQILPMLLLALWMPLPMAAHAGSQVAPPPAAVVETTAIKGVPGADAVVYRQNGLRLGAVVREDGTPTLMWSRRLPADPVRLFSPGPRGLLAGIVRFAGSQKAQVFAYIVRPTGVVSAMPGHPSGEITASEGANFHGLSFTLKTPDSSHVGSVKYRIETTYSWGQSTYSIGSRIRVPDYAKSAYPTPNATVTTKAGDIALIRLEIADTEALRNTGLMYRTSLDPDSGMIFVWPSPVSESFWMENTYIPLSIAFLAPDGKVQEMLDMDPLTTTLHTPALSYQYAIEANLGYFKSAGIVPGDTFQLHLTP